MTSTALLVALAGCGTQNGSPTEQPDGGDVPTTPRALAAVAVEYAGTPASATREEDAAEEFAGRAVGAELRYGSDGEYDGDLLAIAVGEGLDPGLNDCDSEATAYLAGCVETDRGVLLWEAEAPEEDPGVVYVVVEKGESEALLFYAGPSITGDPRDLDLPLSVETLFDIAGDPRVDVTTSQEAVESGEELPYWRG